MIVLCGLLMLAVRAREQPVEVAAEPVPEALLIGGCPARRSLQETNRVDNLDEPPRVDDSASALLIDAANELSKAKMRSHARGWIEEPAAYLRRCARGVLLVSAEVVRKRQ